MTTALAPNDMLRQAVDLLSSHPKGCSFATLTYRAKETGELAKHRLRLGVNFVNMYEKDRALLADLLPTLEAGCLRNIACRELLDSITESLTVGIGNNSRYTLKGKFFESPAFPGIKIMTPEDAENPKEIGLYITAISDGKTVIEPGTYKHVNHRPLTVAKNEIREMLRTSSIRTFRLANVARAAMFGEVLELEGAP
jgi:hypothetical protein